MGSAVINYNRRLSLDAHRIRCQESSPKNFAPIQDHRNINSNANPNTTAFIRRSSESAHQVGSSRSGLLRQQLPTDSETSESDEEESRKREKRKGSRRFSLDFFSLKKNKQKEKKLEDVEKGMKYGKHSQGVKAGGGKSGVDFV